MEDDLRAVFNAVRSEAHTGGQWRFLPNGDREQIAALSEQVQQVTGNRVELAFVD